MEAMETLKKESPLMASWISQMLEKHQFDNIELYKPELTEFTPEQYVVTVKKGKLEIEIVGQRNTTTDASGYLGASFVYDKFGVQEEGDLGEGGFDATTWLTIFDEINACMSAHN